MKIVINIMRAVFNQLSGQPNVTNHTFQIGYITQLWKDSKDIEFIKQIIEHRSIDTTSSYVDILSDKEREQRMDQI